MAISWGSWDYSGGNGMRVGLDISTSSVTTSSTQVVFTVDVYTENQYNYADPQKLTYGGSIGGSTSYTNNQTTGQQPKRATKTYTYKYSTWGSSPGSRTFKATVSGTYNGVTPTKSVTLPIPARPLATPAAPTALKAVRAKTGTTAALSWTNHATGGRPYTSIYVETQAYTGGAWGAWTSTATLSGSKTSTTATGLTATVPYRWRVKAHNGGGDSDYVVSAAANPVTSSTKPPPPGAVVIDRAQACYPWDASLARLVTGSHAQRVAATLTTGYGDSFSQIADLDIISGTVTWDESQIPRVTATLVLPALTADQRAAADPRTRPRVLITPGYRMPSGRWDDEQVADLQIRSLDATRPDNTVSVTATSDEIYPMEQPLADSPDLADLTVDAATYLTATIQGAFPAADTPTVTVTVPATTVTYPASKGDRWANIVDICDVLDADIYDNGDRVINITPRQYATAISRARLATGAGGTITAVQAGVTRDDWANAVQILYTPLDPATSSQYRVGSARVTGGDYAVDTVGYRRQVVARTGYPSQVQADTAAAALLRRYLGRARTLTLTAVAMWWLRPGDTITVAVPDYPDQARLLVSSVTYDIAARTMTITTRAPDWVAAQIGT